jgi:CubicO group peptidase (beta-lactamase class C family)
MKHNVESKRIPGGVLLIARNGRVAVFESFGYQQRSSSSVMKTDCIFRIASMSKPITSVAAMILAEQGKLDIGAPVAQYLPEFKDMKVGMEKVAPRRPMTVQDLLRHTSGLTYGIFGSTPVDELYNQNNVFGSKSLAEMISTVAKLPLLHQPGEIWSYTSRAKYGNTVCPAMSWAASSKWSAAWNSIASSPNTSQARSRWSTRASISRRSKPRGSPIPIQRCY